MIKDNECISSSVACLISFCWDYLETTRRVIYVDILIVSPDGLESLTDILDMDACYKWRVKGSFDGELLYLVQRTRMHILDSQTISCRYGTLYLRAYSTKWSVFVFTLLTRNSPSGRIVWGSGLHLRYVYFPRLVHSRNEINGITFSSLSILRYWALISHLWRDSKWWKLALYMFVKTALQKPTS